MNKPHPSLSSKRRNKAPMSAAFALALLFGAGLLIGACSTTRRIPQGEQLYVGLKKVEVSSDVWLPADTAKKRDAKPHEIPVPEAVTEEIKTTVSVKPNNPLFGSASIRSPFPVGLWVYNNWNPDSHGLKHWLYEKLVSEPVLVSDVRPEVRTKMIDEILDNNGYFRGTSSYELLTQKNPKKAKISYSVTTGPAYLLDSIALLPDTCHLYSLIDSIARKDPYLTRGNRYCTDSLSAVRIRITNALRNKGYYYFRPDYIEYLADSLQTPCRIALRMMVASNLPKMLLERYRTGQVTLTALRNRGGGTPDTVHLERATLIQMMPSRLRHQLIPECITFRKGQYFSVRRMNSTQTRLSRLAIFNAIDMQVSPDTTATVPTLDVDVVCTFDTPLEATIELNASSKSNSYMGPGILLGVTNRNLWGGGEQLGVSLSGSYEWSTGPGHGASLNSYEIGLTTSLAFPRMLAPNFIKRRQRNLNWTRFSLNGDFLNRPHFFRMGQLNLSMNYEWQSSRYSSHSWTPFKLTYTNLLHTTAKFDSITASNPAIRQSFEDQFIPQMAYTYTYDRAIDSDNLINWTFTVSEAGNLFWAIYEACGKTHEKKLFGTPFSQYIKGQTQFIWNHRLFPGDHWLVSRVLVGAEHAYGNSKQVPYAEQFYIGGANSIRAFTVRSLGPGSYRPPEDVRDSYFDQTGTFKFELNTEYRFPILGPLHGAVFIDAGNVWLLRKDPLRPGGQLRAKTFFKDIALGTGVGLRFDIGMLVLRGDLGIGIHAPYDTGKHGYYNMTSFGKSLAFHLAIGYPF